MDDFNINSLHESKNEYGARLLSMLTPLIIQGYKSMFREAVIICEKNKEMEKYLMTFQNLINQVPRWTSVTIDGEKNRICEATGCNHLEDLLTTVHILQLKSLTAMRVGQKQKKIDIPFPKINEFIHKVYIEAGRKIYSNTYLFELGIPPLQVQKNNRELEILVRESIMLTIRDSIPIKSILDAFLSTSTEYDVTEEVSEKVIQEPIHAPPAAAPMAGGGAAVTLPSVAIPNAADLVSLPTAATDPATPVSVSFSDIDYSETGAIDAPKTIERLETISTERYLQRKAADAGADADEDSDKISIGASIPLQADELSFDEPAALPPPIFPDLDIEVLE